MSDILVTETEIERRATEAFAAGVPLTECVMHPWTPAYKTYADVYQRLKTEQRRAS